MAVVDEVAISNQLEKTKISDNSEASDSGLIVNENHKTGAGDTGEESSYNEHGVPPLPENTNKRETTDCSKLFMHAMSKKTNMYTASELPLNNPWTFWVERSRRGAAVEEFEANLKKIYTVYTVHLFWGVYYNIPQPSTLNTRSSLHMTRDERKPIWEEEYNRGGGTFRLRVHKRDTDKVWREILMAAVGEQLTEYISANDEICGISVSVRDQEDIVLIWNTNAKESGTARIFDCVHSLLPDTQFISEFYKTHQTHHAFEKHDVKEATAKDQSSQQSISSSKSKSRQNGWQH